MSKSSSLSFGPEWMRPKQQKPSSDENGQSSSNISSPIPPTTAPRNQTSKIPWSNIAAGAGLASTGSPSLTGGGSSSLTAIGGQPAGSLLLSNNSSQHSSNNNNNTLNNNNHTNRNSNTSQMSFANAAQMSLLNHSNSNPSKSANGMTPVGKPKQSTWLGSGGEQHEKQESVNVGNSDVTNSLYQKEHMQQDTHHQKAANTSNLADAGGNAGSLSDSDPGTGQETSAKSIDSSQGATTAADLDAQTQAAVAEVLRNNSGGKNYTLDEMLDVWAALKRKNVIKGAAQDNVNRNELYFSAAPNEPAMLDQHHQSFIQAQQHQHQQQVQALSGQSTLLHNSSFMDLHRTTSSILSSNDSNDLVSSVANSTVNSVANSPLITGGQLHHTNSHTQHNPVYSGLGSTFVSSKSSLANPSDLVQDTSVSNLTGRSALGMDSTRSAPQSSLVSDTTGNNSASSWSPFLGGSSTNIAAFGSIGSNLPPGLTGSSSLANPNGPPPGISMQALVPPEQIQWVYKDVQGNIQGPFNGLLMQEWFSKSWFQQDLLICRPEEPAYYTLKEYITRVNNTITPFLVSLPPVQQQQQQQDAFARQMLFKKQQQQQQQSSQHQPGWASPITPMSPISPWAQLQQNRIQQQQHQQQQQMSMDNSSVNSASSPFATFGSLTGSGLGSAGSQVNLAQFATDPWQSRGTGSIPHTPKRMPSVNNLNSNNMNSSLDGGLYSNSGFGGIGSSSLANPLTSNSSLNMNLNGGPGTGVNAMALSGLLNNEAKAGSSGLSQLGSFSDDIVVDGLGNTTAAGSAIGSEGINNLNSNNNNVFGNDVKSLASPVDTTAATSFASVGNVEEDEVIGKDDNKYAAPVKPIGSSMPSPSAAADVKLSNTNTNKLSQLNREANIEAEELAKQLENVEVSSTKKKPSAAASASSKAEKTFKKRESAIAAAVAAAAAREPVNKPSKKKEPKEAKVVETKDAETLEREQKEKAAIAQELMKSIGADSTYTPPVELGGDHDDEYYYDEHDYADEDARAGIDDIVVTPKSSRTASASGTPATSHKPVLAPWAKKDVTKAAKKTLSLKEIQEMEAAERKSRKVSGVGLVAPNAGGSSSNIASISSNNANNNNSISANSSSVGGTTPKTSNSSLNYAGGSGMSSSSSSSSSPSSTLLSSLIGGPGSSSSGSANAHLPSGATWATVGSRTSTPKKTLAQIQKEEEAAKKKQSSSGNVLSAANVAGNAAKRFADVTGSGVGVGGVNMVKGSGGAWTTVGPGGRKVNPGSGAVVGTTVNPLRKVEIKPIASTSVSTTSSSSAGTVSTSSSSSATNASGSNTQSSRLSAANEEFDRWSKNSLQELASGVSRSEVLTMLMSLPATSESKEIIADIIYSHSTTMDGRRYAEEFVKRRQKALGGGSQDGFSLDGDDRFLSSSGTGSSAAAGNWSSVVSKKKEAADEWQVPFKVVGKKKRRE